VEDQRVIVFNALKDRFHNLYKFEDFCHDYRDWEFKYIYKQNLCIGAVIVNNGYIHIIIDEKYRKKWASKGLIARLIKESMVHGVAKTTVFKDDEYRTAFAKRIGFKLIEDGETQTYEVKYEELWQ